MRYHLLALSFFTWWIISSEAFSVVIFSPQGGSRTRKATRLHVISGSGRRTSKYSRGGGAAYGAGAGGRGQQDRSKRQERVGHLVQTELSRIIHTGNVKGRDVTFLDDDVRQRISVVNVDVSPDLRQARVSVSIRAPKPPSSTASTSESVVAGAGDAVVDKRRAYSWLVTNTKQIRHTLAQKMSHMKSCPNLSFAQVDVRAAVDVMYLIDQVSKDKRYKRREIDIFDGADYLAEEEDDGDDEDGQRPSGVVGGVNFDEEIDDDDWVEEDDEFFG